MPGPGRRGNRSWRSQVRRRLPELDLFWFDCAEAEVLGEDDKHVVDSCGGRSQHCLDDEGMCRFTEELRDLPVRGQLVVSDPEVVSHSRIGEVDDVRKGDVVAEQDPREEARNSDALALARPTEFGHDAGPGGAEVQGREAFRRVVPSASDAGAFPASGIEPWRLVSERLAGEVRSGRGGHSGGIEDHRARR